MSRIEWHVRNPEPPPVEEPDDTIHLDAWLVVGDAGKLYVKTEDEDGCTWFLATIGGYGIYLNDGLPKELGLALGRNNSLKISE